MNDAANKGAHPFLQEGEIDPVFGKKVKLLILQSASLFVYIDDRLEIQWIWTRQSGSQTDFGKVLNRQAYPESKARFITDEKRNLHIQRMIVEGVARYMDSLPLEQAKEIHDIVEGEIRECSIRMSWQWYFNAAYSLVTASMFLMMLAWTVRTELRDVIGVAAFDVVFGTLMGSIGALLSIASRGDRLTLDANAGAVLHRTEGLARVLVGMAGALLAALAFKGRLLLNSFDAKGSTLATLLFLHFVAGASERLVPSLIAKVDAAHAETKQKDK